MLINTSIFAGFESLEKEIQGIEALSKSVSQFVINFEKNPPNVDAQPSVLKRFVEKTTETYHEWCENPSLTFQSDLYQFFILRFFHLIFSGDESYTRYGNWIDKKIEFLASFLNFEHLDITSNERLSNALRVGCDKIKNISISNSVTDKIQCLMEVASELSNGFDRECSADDLVPLIVLALVKSKIPKIYQEILFCYRFNTNNEYGQVAYILTVVFGGITFIESITQSALSIDGSEYKKHESLFRLEKLDFVSPHERAFRGKDSFDGDETNPKSPSSTSSTQSKSSDSKEWWSVWCQGGSNSDSSPGVNQLLEDAYGSGITKSGYISKQGLWSPAWKNRYFVLKGKILFYFKSPNDHQPRGYITLQFAYIRKNSSRNGLFEICVPSRVFKLNTENYETAKDWIRVLIDATYSKAVIKLSSSSRRLFTFNDRRSGSGSESESRRMISTNSTNNNNKNNITTNNGIVLELKNSSVVQLNDHVKQQEGQVIYNTNNGLTDLADSQSESSEIHHNYRNEGTCYGFFSSKTGFVDCFLLFMYGCFFSPQFTELDQSTNARPVVPRLRHYAVLLVRFALFLSVIFFFVIIAWQLVAILFTRGSLF